MRLSVVLATYNEEENLSACLDSVFKWCDEIVIVDGSSTDKTVAIAKKYRVRVYIHDNPPIFHINKQKAINYASGEWILQLDADERVTPELKKEIDWAIKKAGVNGYWIPRKNYFLGRFLMKGGVYPDYTLRLYRKGKGYLPAKDVHEQTVVSGNIGYLHASLIHMADTSLKRYLYRYNRYTDLIAQELIKKHEKFSVSLLINYVFIQPVSWFLSTFLRHKAFLDSWQGFVFSFFSALRFPVAYYKFLTKK